MFINSDEERELFRRLSEADRRIAATVAAQGCSKCGRGKLNNGNYQRKPRFREGSTAWDGVWERCSLVCAQCRRRTLPPSVMFLGRKVYVELVVIAAAVLAQRDGVDAAVAATGVPALTIRRWLGYWQRLVDEGWWREMRALFATPPVAASMPTSLVEQAQQTGEQLVRWLARVLAGGTTWLRDAARFVRSVFPVEVVPVVCAKDVAGA